MLTGAIKSYQVAVANEKEHRAEASRRRALHKTMRIDIKKAVKQIQEKHMKTTNLTRAAVSALKVDFCEHEDRFDEAYCRKRRKVRVYKRRVAELMGWEPM